MKIIVILLCGYLKGILCCEKNYFIKCEERCKWKLDCGYDCIGFCYEECKVKECKVEVCKEFLCGY